MKNETKIGLFVFIVVAGLIFLTVKVGNFKFYKKGYRFFARFDQVGSL